jgi:hypothetical protein
LWKPTMSFDIFVNDTCPKGRKPIKLITVAPHPTRRDLAVHNLECTDCELVAIKTLFR